jgi:hypothetical protein
MSKEKRKNFEVKQENGETIKMFVVSPPSSVLSGAQRVAAKVWTDCVRDKIMTKQELKNFMYENNLWDSSKDVQQVALSNEIQQLEKELYIGKNGQKTMKTSEAKEIAIKMRIARSKLRDLIAEKMSLEQNTAEAISENARFDFIVSKCTFYEDGKAVYENLDDYNQNSDSDIAFEAASNMAQLIYALDKDFEKNLPENRFLTNKGLVNNDLALVNNEGETVDTNGRRINEYGYYINNDGQRTDIDGNLLDEDGNYVPSLEYVDDEQVPQEEVKTNTKTKRRISKKPQKTV